MCVTLIAAMFFVTFNNSDLKSMNIEVSPIKIRAKNPVASPTEMPPKEIEGNVGSIWLTSRPSTLTPPLGRTNASARKAFSRYHCHGDQNSSQTRSSSYS